MKIYELLVIVPGIGTKEYEIKASYMMSGFGVYKFYKENNELICSFPMELTIIESVK